MQNMKDIDSDTPIAAERFRDVPVVQTDGRPVRIPIEMTDHLDSSPVPGTVLHITMTKDVFCVWRER